MEMEESNLGLNTTFFPDMVLCRANGISLFPYRAERRGDAPWKLEHGLARPASSIFSGSKSTDH